jgi:regulator of protease activity HflC (stomatin/prohibitin superfamily)
VFVRVREEVTCDTRDKVARFDWNEVRLLLLAGCALALLGCGGAVIEPGHRALLFDPSNGGLKREILLPGYHHLPSSARVDDFDVTYSSRPEPLHVITSEGLPLDVRVSVIYRPIIAELYELDTEIGRGYYDEVVGPELRAAARDWFARHSYAGLIADSAKVEDEIEREVRVRASVTFEAIQLPPELANAVRDRLTAEESAKKQETELQRDTLRQKLESERAWETEKVELERNVERRRLQRAAEGRSGL